jgi:hypothetical protein
MSLPLSNVLTKRSHNAPHCMRVLAGIVLCDILIACLLHAVLHPPTGHWAAGCGLQDM